MENDNRPEPDSLLASINRKEEARGRGRLKIFFGMAAGVGKTFAMLRTAQAMKAQGIEVVVGYVETHGRKETEALLQGLEIVPRISIEYRNVKIPEMDIDGIIKRKPAFVLIDELAHTNTEGMRHAKRYQDVQEILDNGINVFTTLNVQHVESLVDTVKQITGITIHETVPDSILDAADEIELIDLSPDELLKRLADGKVYTKDKTAAAIGNFFREGNLTALREIALRKTAERVDLQLKDYMQEHQISGPWKAAERLMVAVGPSPYSEQLIRWTRRIAANLEASWVVVYVKTSQPLSDEAEERLKKNIALAQELGATLVTTTGDDVVSALIRTARQNNVTQIVIGKSMTNPLVDFLHGGSLVNRLIRESGGIDIYVVKSDSTAPEKKRFQFIPPPSLRSPVRHYALSCGAIIAAALACYAVLPVVDYRSIGMVLLFVVSLLSLSVGRGPILAAAALGAVVWDFFFIPPHFTFSISYPADWLVLLLYFIVALVTGTLTSRARIHERAVRDRESDATSFYAMVGELSSAETVRDVVALAGVHLGSFFNAEVTFYSTGPSEKDLPRQPHPLSGFKPDSDKEWSVAEWVFENRKPAGLGTKTLPFAKATYYPLLTQGGCIGVVGFVPHNKRSFTFKNEILLQMFLHQIALAIERIHLRSDRLGKTLLNSISHELRTPLTTITTAATALLDRTTMANQAALDMCITDINTASARLNRLVDNLLDMTRIESGSLQIHREWCDVADLFASVVKNYRPELGNRIVELSVPADMPLVNVDAVLIEQAIANIVLNAAQYTPENKRIILSARHEAGSIILSVEDEGPGVPQESVGRIFDKFYRLPGTVSGGTGLGLSIVKGFIEAHDGAVDARNRDGGGMQFVIRLPTTQAPSTAALEIRTMHDQGTDGIL